MRHLLMILLGLSSSVLGAQVIVRGPYLQSPTHEGITVMWRTSVVSNTRLWCGSHPDSLVLLASSPSLVADHTARIEGLSPNTTYYYAVGVNSTMLAGADSAHRFHTHPVPGSDDPVRVWALGDFGKGNAGQIAVKDAFMAHAGSPGADVWIWLGDNVYDDGLDSEYQSKVFGLQGFKDLFSWLPFYPAPGNHDYIEVWRESAIFGIPYSNIPLEDHHGPYYDIVDVPEEAEAGGYASGLEVYYSFDLGNAHFISLNSEVYDLLGTSDGIDRMVDWLQQDLAQNDRRFTIAYFHQPPYSRGSHDSEEWTEFVMEAMRERVVPVLEDHDVDLVLGGHSHVYERSHLIHGHYGSSGSFDPATMLMDASGGDNSMGTPYRKDTLSETPDGTVYVVCGNGGSSESDPPLDHPVMVRSDGGTGVCGSFVIDISGDRLDGRYLKTDGTIGDHFTIIKGGAEPESVAELGHASGLQVFPNPSYELINVRFTLDSSAPLRLELVSVTGQLIATIAEGVHAAGPFMFSMNIRSLPSGVHHLKLDVDGQVVTRKVVKL
ncbi:MAG: metallophosphoesterase [Flavobacteriales bacterium]|nr:metallophosphoesterase [Flavobacteriales bacterium]